MWSAPAERSAGRAKRRRRFGSFAHNQETIRCLPQYGVRRLVGALCHTKESGYKSPNCESQNRRPDPDPIFLRSKTLTAVKGVVGSISRLTASACICRIRSELNLFFCGPLTESAGAALLLSSRSRRLAASAWYRVAPMQHQDVLSMSGDGLAPLEDIGLSRRSISSSQPEGIA